ncbi:lactate 2-monooxygenase [Tenuibacillus multivorans]|uniref:L-lactate oxidase n=1 Tax=Tenuibacillus multivorans TaxID=237069 RepID=A0A1G9WJV2_9BACI|nr:lactate 2-monooxygenase [Tenuibacillus multivorans]GEL76495.1 oxidoreductase [Tenuibacillus multivorans]SDM84804.1 FMN-dependent dehydrogenase, includes L-lactate dehydrogenase and type II isopentenyl diphosphate isomerase [Tenuibacillus multivorans]
MKNIGNQVQYSIYQTMQNPDPNRLPIAYEEWEKKAREKLKDGPFYYVAGGAGGERTMDTNVSDFNQWKIMPRMLNNVDDRDLSVELFGQTYPSPAMLAPVGVQSIIHEEGEIGTAKACAELGVPYTTSSASTIPMEKIAEVMGDAPRWFQLYWSRDPEITASFLKRAEASGYSAIVVTLDTPMMAWREIDLKNVYLPFLIGEGLGNYFTDPAFLSKLDKTPQEDPQTAIMHWTQIFGNTGLTWDDIAFLKEHTHLPIILKGILHPDDASLALKHGVDGIIVSNHGGRQVDGAISAIEALPMITEVVGDQIPVMMDSGIRRGSDIIKAMALGAKAVLVGRPAMYGLAVAGQRGVYEVMRNMLADLDITLGLIGKSSVRELDSSVLKKVTHYQSKIPSV